MIVTATIPLCIGILMLLCAAILPALLLLKGKRLSRGCALVLVGFAVLLLLAASLMILVTGTATGLFAFELAPGVVLSFLVDRLAAFFLMLIAIVAFAVTIYSFPYVEHLPSRERKNGVVSLMAVFILSMALLAASADIISFLVFWELMSISSFFLVMTEYDHEQTKKAGIFYFVMTQLSTAFLLFAFLLLSHASGSTSIASFSTIDGLVLNIAFIALCVGFGIKAGVIPFHKWLPYAHPASPSNISALMSGVMIKIAIYGLVRFLFTVAHPPLWWGLFILFAGTLSAVLGVIYALKEHDLKRLLAYHSIENIGIILIGLGLAIIFTYYGLTALATLSLLGALFHTLNHALFKSLLFLTAGSVVEATGTKNIEEMGGLARKMPVTSVLFLIGAVAISALPPLNGFASELMIFQAFLHSGAIGEPLLETVLFLCLALFALTSALAAACFVKAYGITFLAMPRSVAAEKAKEAPLPMLIGPALLALLCIFLGVFSRQIFAAAGFDLPIPDLLLVGALLLGFFGVAIVGMRFVARRGSRVSETWGCGIPVQSSNMEYTASGFSQPIIAIFKPIYQPTQDVHREYADQHQVIFVRGSVHINLKKFFEQRVYTPLQRLVNAVSVFFNELQNPTDSDQYILIIFVVCLCLLLIGGWFI